MKLHTYKTMPPHEIRHEFKNNSWRGFFYVTLIFMAITAFIATPKGGAENTELAVVPGAVTLFFASLGTLRFRQYRLQNNWILRVTPSGLLVNLRSHHHYFFPEHTPCVLELDREEIAAIGKTQVSGTIPTSHSEAREHHSYIMFTCSPATSMPSRTPSGWSAASRSNTPTARSPRTSPYGSWNPIASASCGNGSSPGKTPPSPSSRKAIPWRPIARRSAPSGRIPMPKAGTTSSASYGKAKDTVRLIQAEHSLTPRKAREWIREHLEPMG